MKDSVNGRPIMRVELVADGSIKGGTRGLPVLAASEYSDSAKPADGRPILAVSTLIDEGMVPLPLQLYAAGTLKTPDGRPVLAVRGFDAAGAPVSLGGGGGFAIGAPVLALDTDPGTNPPQYSRTWGTGTIFDGIHYVVRRWTYTGSFTGAPTCRLQITSDRHVDGFVFTAAAGGVGTDFPAVPTPGSTISVQEGVCDSAGVMLSDWSNIVADTMPAVPDATYTPTTVLPNYQTGAMAYDFPGLVFAAGKPLVACYPAADVTGVKLIDASLNEYALTRLDGMSSDEIEAWASSTIIPAGTYTVHVDKSATSLQAIWPGTLQNAALSVFAETERLGASSGGTYTGVDLTVPAGGIGIIFLDAQGTVTPGTGITKVADSADTFFHTGTRTTSGPPTFTGPGVYAVMYGVSFQKG